MRFPATPGWVLLSAVVGAPRHSWLKARGAVARHSWLGSAGGGGVWSLATPGCGSRSQFPAPPGWRVRWWRCWVGPCHSWLRVSGAAPRHSWLGSAGRGGWCFDGWGFPVLFVLVARRVRVVPVLVCVVGCVFVVSVLEVVWVWAGLLCVFVCLCVCACVVCQWRAVWCGVVCWWGCSWCVVWLVPRHSWRRFLWATPRHSWLGFAAGGGGRSSPLLAEGLGGGSPPLLAGVRRPQWWVFPRVGVSRVVCACGAACPCGACAGLCGVFSWCLCWWWYGRGRAFRLCLCVCVCVRVWCVGGVRCGAVWCVGGVVAGVWCGWSLATPGRGSCVLLPATPGWVSLPVVVGVPRHSCLRVPDAVPRHSWLGSAGGGGVRLPATPGWGLPVVVVCFAGGDVPGCVCFRCVWLCAVAVLCCVLRVCGVCVVGGVVWWCGGCVFRVYWCAWLRVCGVPVVCDLVSPPLLVWACGWCLCGCGCCVVWVPRHFWLRDVGAAPRHSWLGSAAVRWWLAPCHSWPWGLVAGPRHSWLGSAVGCRGRSLATPGRGPWAWFPTTPGRGPLVVVVGALGALLLGLGVRVCAV